MNNIIEDFVKEIRSKFDLLDAEYPALNQVSLDFNSDEIAAALAHVKASGWKQLSLLTCVDWIDENKFQLVYLVFNWENGIRIQIRTAIDRENPKFATMTSIYPGAQYYERDVHEFFGVEFEGNADSYKHLFLENWDDIPPMRKDFDSLTYSNKKYPARKYKADFNTKAGDRK